MARGGEGVVERGGIGRGLEEEEVDGWGRGRGEVGEVGVVGRVFKEEGEGGVNDVDDDEMEVVLDGGDSVEVE